MAPKAMGMATRAGAALRVFDSPHTPPSDLAGNPILPWKFPITVIHSPVGGRLQLFSKIWQAVGAEDWVLNVLWKGYTLNFFQRVQLSPVPIEFQESKDPMIVETKHKIIMEYLDKEAIEIALTPLSPGFYSFNFLRQKKSEKWGAIISLKPLNQHLVKYKFRMLTPQGASFNSAEGPLDHFSGLIRCLPPHSNPCGVKEVSQICPHRCRLPAQSPSVRVVRQPVCIHMSYKGSAASSSVKWNPNFGLPR